MSQQCTPKQLFKPWLGGISKKSSRRLHKVPRHLGTPLSPNGLTETLAFPFSRAHCILRSESLARHSGSLALIKHTTRPHTLDVHVQRMSKSTHEKKNKILALPVRGGRHRTSALTADSSTRSTGGRCSGTISGEQQWPGQLTHGWRYRLGWGSAWHSMLTVKGTQLLDMDLATGNCLPCLLVRLFTDVVWTWLC